MCDFLESEILPCFTLILHRSQGIHGRDTIYRVPTMTTIVTRQIVVLIVMLNEVKHLAVVAAIDVEMFRFAQHDSERHGAYCQAERSFAARVSICGIRYDVAVFAS